MTKQISPKTQMTQKMEAFIAGRTRGCDIVLPNGEQVFYVAPGPIARGYIYWFVGDVKWTADLKKNDAKHVTCVKQERMTPEQQMSYQKHVLKALKEFRHKEFYTMKVSDLFAVNASIDQAANWLLDHGVAV